MASYQCSSNYCTIIFAVPEEYSDPDTVAKNGLLEIVKRPQDFVITRKEEVEVKC